MRVLSKKYQFEEDLQRKGTKTRVIISPKGDARLYLFLRDISGTCTRHYLKSFAVNATAGAICIVYYVNTADCIIINSTAGWIGVFFPVYARTAYHVGLGEIGLSFGRTFLGHCRTLKVNVQVIQSVPDNKYLRRKRYFLVLDFIPSEFRLDVILTSVLITRMYLTSKRL